MTRLQNAVADHTAVGSDLERLLRLQLSERPGDFPGSHPGYERLLPAQDEQPLDVVLVCEESQKFAK